MNIKFFKILIASFMFLSFILPSGGQIVAFANENAETKVDPEVNPEVNPEVDPEEDNSSNNNNNNNNNSSNNLPQLGSGFLPFGLLCAGIVTSGIVAKKRNYL